MHLNVAFTTESIKASAAELTRLQEEVARDIPTEYLEFLRDFGSGDLEANDLRLDVEVAGEVSVREFFSPERAIEQRHYWTDRVPADFLVIADSAGGNLICLSLHDQEDKFGAVYYWDHDSESGEDEEPDEENMTRITETLAEFLTALHPASDVELAEGTTGWIDPDFLKSLEEQG